MIFDDFFGNIEPEAGATRRLLGRKVRIEYFVQLIRRDASSVVFDTKIDIEIFGSAADADNSAFFRTCLDCVDDDVLNRTIELQRISKKDARIVTDRDAEGDSLLVGDGSKSPNNFFQRGGTETALGGEASTLP